MWDFFIKDVRVYVSYMKKRIAVAMSGGVDSSVAAALLVKQGYDVTGFFVVNYNHKTEGHGECWRGDYRDAVRVAAKLGIPLFRIDCVKEYKEKVIEYLITEYKKGNTPNPDVMCNKYIKFDIWRKKLKEKGFPVIATGHYASVEEDKKGIYHLKEATDKEKDQTYFLHQLTQEQLSSVVFPLGKYTKKEVRELAKKWQLPTASKEESMGICFIGEISMKDFLIDHGISTKKGYIKKFDTQEVLGEHIGLPFYTIGQRHGFSQKGGEKPLFVVAKDLKTNTLFVGDDQTDSLYTSRIYIQDIHWIASKPPDLPLEILVRFRHRQPLQQATIDANGDTVVIQCKERQQAITPGQFAVIYRHNDCVGGGTII